mmetsp:Transcript_2685/g.4008  ORF Transcript_2685/g.4008 Transcript_2685/m.4008 type:complete len:423 (+) Transcript_2685:623-1891(+)
MPKIHALTKKLYHINMNIFNILCIIGLIQEKTINNIKSFKINEKLCLIKKKIYKLHCLERGNAHRLFILKKVILLLKNYYVNKFYKKFINNSNNIHSSSYIIINKLILKMEKLIHCTYSAISEIEINKFRNTRLENSKQNDSFKVFSNEYLKKYYMSKKIRSIKIVINWKLTDFFKFPVFKCFNINSFDYFVYKKISLLFTFNVSMMLGLFELNLTDARDIWVNSRVDIHVLSHIYLINYKNIFFLISSISKFTSFKRCEALYTSDRLVSFILKHQEKKYICKFNHKIHIFYNFYNFSNLFTKNSIIKIKKILTKKHYIKKFLIYQKNLLKKVINFLSKRYPYINLLYYSESLFIEENELIVNYILNCFKSKVLKTKINIGRSGYTKFKNYQIRQSIKNSRRFFSYIHKIKDAFICKIGIYS